MLTDERITDELSATFRLTAGAGPLPAARVGELISNARAARRRSRATAVSTTVSGLAAVTAVAALSWTAASGNPAGLPPGRPTAPASGSATGGPAPDAGSPVRLREVVLAGYHVRVALPDDTVMNDLSCLPESIPQVTATTRTRIGSRPCLTMFFVVGLRADLPADTEDVRVAGRAATLFTRKDGGSEVLVTLERPRAGACRQVRLHAASRGLTRGQLLDAAAVVVRTARTDGCRIDVQGAPPG